MFERIAPVQETHPDSLLYALTSKLSFNFAIEEAFSPDGDYSIAKRKNLLSNIVPAN